MAEKEERILCIETDEKIVECGYGDFYNTMTRQEAIEKMAKGIHCYEWEHTSHFPMWCELNDDIKNDYRNMAEAALNALLEGK